MQETLNAILNEITKLNSRFDKIEDRFDNLESRMSSFENKVSTVESDIKDIKKSVLSLTDLALRTQKEVKLIKDKVFDMEAITKDNLYDLTILKHRLKLV